MLISNANKCMLVSGTIETRYILQTCESILLPTSIYSGDSSGLSVEGIAGRVLLILTEVILLLVWVLLIVFMAVQLICDC